MSDLTVDDLDVTFTETVTVTFDDTDVRVTEQGTVLVLTADHATVAPTGDITVTVDDAVTVTVGGSPGPRGPAGESGSGTIVKTAGQTLSGHRAVVLDGSGEAVYADPATVGLAQVLLTLNAATVGGDVELLGFGEHTEPSWSWTPGSTLYLDAGGALTETVPVSGFLVPLAEAVTAVTVFFNPRIPIALGA